MRELFTERLSADRALARLKEGNKDYINSITRIGNISPELRRKTAAEGQFPFAVIVTCSDSRVIPEYIFSAGIGELFVIRVAGNVVGEHELGSIEYAVSHLGCRLVVVLGHSHCGAIHAALHGEPEGCVKTLTDGIRLAIGGETDEAAACELNVRFGASKIENYLAERNLPYIAGDSDRSGDDAEIISVVGAVYDIESGRVEFLQRQ